MIKNYISVKMVKAEPCKAWKDFKGHMTGDEGYKIYYPDGYVSWCPKDIFEAQYLELEKEDTITQKDVCNFITSTSITGANHEIIETSCKNGFVITNFYNMGIGKENHERYIFAQIYNLLTFLLQCAKSGFKGDK